MSARRPQANRRRSDLAKIHIAAKDLGLDRETYEAVLYEVAGVTSAADLDAAGRAAVLEHFKSKGWQAKKTGAPRRTSPSGDKWRQMAKVNALLASAGRPQKYADAMSKRMFGVDRWEWLKPPDLHKLIGALSIDQRRRAVRS